MKCSIIDIPKEIDISDQKISKQELYDAINKASTHIESSIKLYIEKEEEHIVVFSWKDRNKWKIDYPIQLHKIHKQRYVTHKQCLQLSEHIFSGNSLDDLKGFIDIPIRHFTLDEMLQFKKEDEMMLRGEDPDLHKPTPSQKSEISETPKNNPAPKKTSKPSIILGDISVPKEESRSKSVPRVTDKKKQQTSPLKQFKESTEQLKKEKEQSSIAKTPTKPILKKTNKHKKDSKPSLILGEQLGVDQNDTPTLLKSKDVVSKTKTSKPATNDNSLFSI